MKKYSSGAGIHTWTPSVLVTLTLHAKKLHSKPSLRVNSQTVCHARKSVSRHPLCMGKLCGDPRGEKLKAGGATGEVDDTDRLRKNARLMQCFRRCLHDPLRLVIERFG